MAGGYVINDIFDLKVDLINRPELTIINKLITEHQAKIIYICWNSVGLGIAFILAYQLNRPAIGAVLVGTVIVLFFYSQYFQGVILVGNVIVALLCGLVIWIIQMAGQDDVLGATSGQFFVFGLFAFAVTLWRELIKDLQDVEGDKKNNLQTLAQLANGKYSILLSKLIGAIIVFGILWALQSNWQSVNPATRLYGLGLIATASLIVWKLFSVQIRTQLKLVSFYQKLFMIQGILITFFWHG